MSLNSVIRSQHRTMAVESDYTIYAAPESIEAYIQDALAAREALDNHIDWLVLLLGARREQVKRGLWPERVVAEHKAEAVSDD